MKWALKKERSPATAKSLSVSDLTRRIKGDLERQFRGLWVEGEVSGCRYHGSGHIYFTLKDSGAQISGAIWRSTANRLPLRLEDGMQVLMFGNVSVYPPRGSYQFIVERVEPKGAGQLQLAFEQLKAKLQGEGLFEPELKQPLPSMPKCIGIVTSETGAALRDVLQVMGRRFPLLHVVVAGARMQGVGSADQVVQALGALDDRDDIDVILLTRGGGSLEDLWTFNEESVVRAIAAAKKPVMSAIGHEIDNTLSDFVADARAPTPSAAAEQLVPDGQALAAYFIEMGERSELAIFRRLDDYQLRISALSERLRDPSVTLGHNKKRLAQNHARMCLAMERLLEQQASRLREQHTQLKLQSPQRKLVLQREQLLGLDRAVNRQMQQALRERALLLANLVQRLDALSPLAVLKRGYALVTDEDGVVRKPPAPGTRLNIRLAEGSVNAEVVE